MALLSKIFKKRDDTNIPRISDFSPFVVDIHSHLIPGIDDGSKTMEESLDLIRRYKALGFKKLITTPHIMSDAFRNTPDIILGGLDKLREAIRKEGLDMEVDAAAEYYFDADFTKLISQKNLMTIAGKYVLFEVSYMNAPDNIMQVVFDLQIAGYTPILAHPERYPFWYQRFDEYHKLKEAGTLLQLNTNSLCGYYGPDAKKVAEKMVDANLIDFIGSDMHGARHMDALERTVNEKYLWKLASRGMKNSGL